MAHQSDIETEKNKQWVKAALGLKYLKEGLAPFCDDVSKQQHQDILDTIKREKHVQSVICGICTMKILQPDHVKPGHKQCPYGQPNCCNTSGKHPCPNNVCGAIYDSIITYHASTPPAPYWKNTQTQQWIADTWSIAKCFINAPGYEQKTSAADTDCKGLFDLIINNKYFHNHVSCNMNGPNIFSKVRQYRNEILHSSTMELDSQQLNSYIDDMIAVLQDGKELTHRLEAQEAVYRLQNLKRKDLYITTREVEHVLGDIVEDIGFIKTALEETKHDCEDLKLKVATLKTSTSELKEIAHKSSTTGISEPDVLTACYDVENVLLKLNSLRQNPDPNLSHRIDVLKDKPLDPVTLKEIEETVDDTQKWIHITVESLRRDHENLRIISEKLYKIEIEIYKKEMASHKGIPWTHDEYPEAKTRFESEWTNCIENKYEDKAYNLLEKGQLPDAALLDRACQKFGLKSPLLKAMCIGIEEKITASSDFIIYTNACYKETEKDKILLVFVVITRGGTDYVDLSKEKYNVLVRRIDNYSKEGRMVIDKEMGLQFEDLELEALEIVLKDKSPDLMEKHTNLSLTTGSMFKSQNQGENEMSLAQKVCIVFFVTVKGLIPVGEDLLPKKLGQFDTDVREGRFAFAVGGQPGVKHKHLKLGCRISCKDGAGTIGGFVQHPEFGVCALTCAHVVLSKEEILGIRKKNDENPGIGKECFQPNYNENGENKCGTIVAVHMKEGKSNNEGVDAALVKIDDDRLPTNGHFPDCDLSDIKGGCSHCKDNLVRKSPSFKKGTVLDTDEITTDYNVVKYGQKTKFTIGTLKVKGGSVRIEHCLDMNEVKQTKDSKKRYQFTLNNLLEIQSMGSPFAGAGDSGALVLSQDNNNKLAAFGLLVGYDSATSITLVQPICSVLKHLELKKPYSLMNFDPRERRIDQLEKSVNDIGKSLHKISEKLDRERR